MQINTYKMHDRLSVSSMRSDSRTTAGIQLFKAHKECQGRAFSPSALARLNFLLSDCEKCSLESRRRASRDA